MIDAVETTTRPSLFESEAGPWLLLSRLPGFGIRRRQAVSEQMPSLSELTVSNAATLKALGLSAEAVDALLAWQSRDTGHPLIKELMGVWVNCGRNALQLLTWSDGDYPEPLRHIHDAPLVLYLKGNRSLLGREQIAVVGSRNASRSGLEHARAFAAELSRQGLLVTSGLALGVDGAAHAGALEAGRPTVAVVATGLDRIYPRQHQALATRIISQGLLVSEYPPGTPARAGQFPKRNRIISGLSRGILVVEASLKSGSLITARLALEQGREVFAIPGSIHNPLARGCHELIRQGARLVETVEDIHEELGSWWQGTQATSPEPGHLCGKRTAGLDAREIAVLDALGYDPQSTDDLCSATGLPADQLMQSLLLLELQGLVDSAPGGFQRIA